MCIRDRDYDTETEGDGMEEHAAHVLSMNSEAKEYFFSWWNEKVERINPVSYTHLDVYKRQLHHRIRVTTGHGRKNRQLVCHFTGSNRLADVYKRQGG